MENTETDNTSAVKIGYNIVMFAHNEADSIYKAVKSVVTFSDHRLNKFYVVANGCTDDTVNVVKSARSELYFPKLSVIEIPLGDKCNAWNHYIHDVAESVEVHFFCDADVYFSMNCFPAMYSNLSKESTEAVAIAGLPLSGRHKNYYQGLIKNRSCFFGNLYGLRNNVVEQFRNHKFTLPIGLGWIDSFLTKAVNTDLTFDSTNRPNRVNYIEGCGYYFDSLSIFNMSDVKLYLSRIARYELGKLQEPYLDELHFREWPTDLKSINHQIMNDFNISSAQLGWFKRQLVHKRLKKQLDK